MPTTREDTAPPIALLRRMEWRVRHAAEDILSGEYRSAFRGRGMEFDQVVKYEYGDDVRDIDWNVTARRGEPYRKKYIEERELTIAILFEDSPSLQFGSGGRTKRAALMELASLIALLCAANRDRLAVLCAASDHYWFRPPARGRGPVLHSAASLLAQPPPEDFTAHPAIPWRFVARAMPRHSILIWMGDFPSAQEPDAWAALRRRFQIMGFRIDDPWDRDLPKAGILTVFDPVENGLIQIDTASRAQRLAHERWATNREAAWAALFPDPLTRLAALTDEPLLDALVGFFQRRMASAARH